ncbi:ECF transporter S component [Thermohalobacter berrensis]|nr:ECF transporter S component [Thermohalobacter berrensis]
MDKTKKIVYSSFFIALGIIIPMLFHTIKNFGRAFLPMHIPVLLGGFILGPYFGLLVGLITPFLSSILTGMPPIFPVGIIMFFELSTYGFVSGLFYNKLKQNEIITLTSAMIIGRIIAALVVAVLVYGFGAKMPNPFTYIKMAVIVGLPGIAIQVILIPILVLSLKRTRILHETN